MVRECQQVYEGPSMCLGLLMVTTVNTCDAVLISLSPPALLITTTKFVYPQLLSPLPSLHNSKLAATTTAAPILNGSAHY